MKTAFIKYTQKSLLFILALIGINDTVIAQYGAPQHFYIVNGIVIDEQTKEPIQNILVKNNDDVYDRQTVTDTNGLFRFNYSSYRNPDEINLQAFDVDGNLNGGKYVSEKLKFNTALNDFIDTGSGWYYEIQYKDTVVIQLRKKKRIKPKPIEKDLPLKDSLSTTVVPYNNSTDSSSVEEITAINKNSVSDSIFRDLSLYPNPTKEYINIRFVSSTEGPLIQEIRIFNLEGKLIINEFINENTKQIERTFYVGEWAKGVYIVQCLSKRGVISKRFIKN